MNQKNQIFLFGILALIATVIAYFLLDYLSVRQFSGIDVWRMRYVLPAIWFGYVLFVILALVFSHIRTVFLSDVSTGKILNIFTGSLLIMLFAVMMLWLAIYNGYPLFLGDSISYLDDFSTLIRPVSYQVLIRAITTLVPSLWAVAVFQALAISYLLIRNARWVIVPDRNRYGIIFLIASLLIVVTDVGLFTTWIMADAFAGWIFLGGLLIFNSPRWYDRYLASAAMGVSLMSHNAHVIIAFLSLGVLCFIAVCGGCRSAGFRKALARLGVLFLTAVFSMCVINFRQTGSFRFSSPGSINYLMNRFIYEGIMSQALDRACLDHTWEMCEYKEQIRTAQKKWHDWYMWGKDSPLKAVWGDDQGERPAVVAYVLRHYPYDVLKSCFNDGLRQLTHFEPYRVRDFTTQQSWSAPIYEQITSIGYPTEKGAILGSRQARGALDRVKILPFSSLKVQRVIFILTLMAMFGFFFLKQRHLLDILSASIGFIVINAFVMGSLNFSQDRYQGRVIWLVAYCLFLTVAAYLSEQWNKRSNETAGKKQKKKGVVPPAGVEPAHPA